MALVISAAVAPETFRVDTVFNEPKTDDWCRPRTDALHMGSSRILITGGAGFVGSHLADELLEHGYQVRVLDNLAPQVHGPDASRPDYLAEDVELFVGDVRDPEAVSRALEGVDAVYHFAATVGVGQSMYQIAEYTSVNGEGTAILLEALARKPVERLVVASSMSIYGEGLYSTRHRELVEGQERSLDQLKGARLGRARTRWRTTGASAYSRDEMPRCPVGLRDFEISAGAALHHRWTRLWNTDGRAALL